MIGGCRLATKSKVWVHLCYVVGFCQGLECCKQRGGFPHDVHFST